MKKLLVFCVVTLALLCPMVLPTAQAAEGPTFLQELTEAAGLLRQGQPADALKLLEGMKNAEPESASQRALRQTFIGMVHARMSRPLLALRALEKSEAIVVKDVPKNLQPPMLYGNYIKQALFRRDAGTQQNETFLNNFKKVELATEPEVLVRAAADLGSHQLAIQWARDWAKKDPKSILAKQLLFNGLQASGRYQEALAMVKELETIKDATDPQKVSLAISLALLFVDLGFSDRAASYLEKVSEKNLTDELKGQYRHTLALVRLQEGKTQEALRLFSQALDLTQASVPEVRSSILAEQARANLTLGNLGKAFEGYTKALDLNPPLLTKLRMLTARGIVLERQGFVKSAMLEHQQAVLMAARSGLPLQVAVGLNNQATAAREGGNLLEALRYQWGAALVDSGTGDTQGLATDFENLGRLYTKMGKAKLARYYIQKARHTHKKADTLLKLRLGRSMGEACRIDADYACARKEFTETARLARTSGTLDLLWMAQAGLARTLRDTGELTASATTFEQALNTIETMREMSGPSANEKAAFLLERRPVYADLLRVYLKQSRNEEAFATMERMRARTLLDRLRESGSRLDEELTPQEQAKEKALELNNKFLLKALNEKRDQSALVAFEKSRAELENFRLALDKKYPKLAFFRGRGGKPSPSVVQKFLRPGDLMVLIHTDEQGAVVFALSPNSFTTHESTILKPQALKLVVQDRLRASIAQGVWGPVQERSAKILHQELLAKALAANPDSQTVLLSPEETLSELPLGVLVAADGKFLGETHGVLTVPSATTWTYARSLRGAPEPGSSWIVLADPIFADPSLSPLKGTEVEAAKMKSLFPKAVQVFTQTKATEDRVEQGANKASLIHFATHGLLDARSPMQSRIALAKNDGGDGFLEVREILNLKLGTALVVLSACDSARGEALAGEGLQGLAQAFLRAGSPRVMATLWEVNDEATSFLVQQFYEELKTTDIAKAMQQAQAKTRTRFGANPFFWAPFVLMGPGWEGDLAALGAGT